MPDPIQSYYAAIEQCQAAEQLVAHYRRALVPADRLAFAVKLHRHRIRQRQRAYTEYLRSTLRSAKEYTL